MTQRERILRAFAGAPATAAAIAERMNLPRGTVHAQCHHLHALKKLARDSTVAAVGGYQKGGRPAIVWRPV